MDLQGGGDGTGFAGQACGLRWAIAEDGRAVGEIAERASVSVMDLQRWLSGDESPSHGQLSRLSEVLGRSRTTLLLPAPPEAASTPTAFRRAVGSGNEVSAIAHRAVRESRQIQKARSWIRRDGDPASVPLSNFSEKPERAAAEVREWSGVSIEDQFRWVDDYEALREWRSCLDARGCEGHLRVCASDRQGRYPRILRLG